VTPTIVPLSTGADARVRNPGAPVAAVLVNGGTAKPVPGTWSATSELLADRLAPARPDVTFVEVRYRVKTWNAIPSCVADAAAALDLARAEGIDRVLMIGFSMGGAVSIGVAEDELVEGVLGLAPWIPDRLPVEGLRGKRLDVVHGAWDRYLPGVPGVSPTSSRRGFERALRAGAHGTYTLLSRAVHGAALRRSSGGLFHLPRWRAWVDETAEALERFAPAPGSP
jgi:pimeloyl-ACP methyl ester carboxylesterase